MNGLFWERFRAPLQGAFIFFASSQGSASLALGYSPALPTGGSTPGSFPPQLATASQAARDESGDGANLGNGTLE
jgi:hypothetical protein